MKPRPKPPTGQGKAELQALLQRVLEHVDRSPKKAAQVLANWVEGRPTVSSRTATKESLKNTVKKRVA